MEETAGKRPVQIDSLTVKIAEFFDEQVLEVKADRIPMKVIAETFHHRRYGF